MGSISKGVTRVILLRHGTSTFNAEGRYQGCSDESLLTPEGRAAARLSGERLKSEGIAAIISSPLQRAVETAREVRAMLQQSGDDVPLLTDARLREVKLSAWEGLRYERVEQKFPTQLSAWRLHPSELCMPLPSGKDSFPVRNLYSRTGPFWEDVVAAYAGKSVLLVTHGGTARAMITSALGLGIDHFQRVQQSNCGISCLSVRRSAGRANLELLNDTAHLTKALPNLKEGRTGVRLLLITADSDEAEDYLECSSILKRLVIDRALIVRPARPSVIPVFGERPVVEEISESRLEWNLKTILEKEMAGQSVSQVVLVAPANFVRKFLKRCMGMPRTMRGKLDLKGVGVTAIHCPGNTAPSVLQGMNLFEWKNQLGGGQV